MQPLLAQRLIHLDTAYPEWSLPSALYCFEWSGGYGFWTLELPTGTLYSPPVLWKNELSVPLAHALQQLGEQAQQQQSEKSSLFAWFLGSVSIALSFTLFAVLNSQGSL